MRSPYRDGVVVIDNESVITGGVWDDQAAADSYFKESYSNIGVRGKYLLTLCY